MSHVVKLQNLKTKQVVTFDASDVEAKKLPEGFGEFKEWGPVKDEKEKPKEPKP